MKATELRVGNWIKQPGKISRVIEIWEEGVKLEGHNNAYDYNHTYPIEITEEWLLNLGFELFEKEGKENYFKILIKKWFTYNSNNGWYWKDRTIDPQPKYVHELQNLFFALEGLELELIEQKEEE